MRWVRHGVMAFFFLFLLHVAYEHQVKGGGPNGSPSIEAYCPFGGVENLYQFITTGGYLRRIEPSAMILLAAVLLLTLLFSRGFCGWICPFGALQEWIGWLGRKIFKRRFNPDTPLLRRLRHLKYVVLVAVVALTWYTGTLVFRDYDPYLAFFHLGKGMSELPWAYAVLGLVLLGSLKYDRFFCRFACPLGAVIGLVGKLGWTKIQRDDHDCKACNLCRKTCFAHVDFLSTKVINDAECNHCLECVAACPKPNVLSLRARKFQFSPAVYGGLLVAGLALTIGVSQAANLWRTKPDRVSFTNAAGQLDAGQIRGWMTLKEVSEGYGVPRQELYRRAGLPEHVAETTRLNKVAEEYKLDFDPEKVREAVGAETPAPPAEKKKAAAHDTKKDDQEVKGFMTLNEVCLKTGVPKEWLLKRLNLPSAIDGRKPLREWMHDRGKSIQDFRDAIQDYRSGKR